MIYFITNDSYHIIKYEDKLYDNIKVLDANLTSTLTLFKVFVEDNDLIGYDIETNGLNEWVNDCILKIIGNEEDQFVFHIPFCDFESYLQSFCYRQNKTFLGHNIKFDLKFLYTKYDVLLRNVYDTMIAEQRLYMKSGLSSSLEQLQIRYLNKYPDKTVREEFIGVDVNTFKIEPRHIYYGVEDIVNLFPIKRKQEKRIEEYNMSLLLYDIEFPLISIIAKADATGFKFNSKAWKVIYQKNVDELFNVECKLDKEFRRLRDETWGNPKDGGLTYFPEKRMFISGGKWDLKRHKKNIDNIFDVETNTFNALDLFGNRMSDTTYFKTKKAKQTFSKRNPNNINYNSDDQIKYIFGRLEEPLLNKQEVLTHVNFNKENKLDKANQSLQTNEDALNIYLTMLPNTRMKTFIELLIKHRGLSKAISTYGLNFINNLNPITNNIHTNFKQCFTDTGRMSSGGGLKEKDKPNFQNIPSKASYAVAMRNCFIARESYSIGTHDLSGAELIIMCSLSQDLKLLRISREDIHSYVAQGSWRLIFRDRAKKLINTFNKNYRLDKNYTNEKLKKQVKDLIDKSRNYIVNKKTEGGKIRTNFKPMTFGTIYGMYANKAGKTLNIIKEEGQIVIDFIKREFPDVFLMVEAASNFARRHGYVILNTRTNSRAWFPNIIQVLKGNMNVKQYWKIISKEMSEARNIKIQGTQADMIKEMSVELQKWIDDNDFTDKITILSWVHDEIVDEHPKYLDGKSKEWNNTKHNINLHYRRNDGTIYTHNNFPDIKAEIMRDVANRYLDNVEMDVDYDVEPYWTK